MQELKRQVSCVRFDLTNLTDLTENLDQNNDDVFIDKDADLELPPPSPFVDKNGQPIKRKSKLTWKKVNEKKNRRHQMFSIACV
jgi:hypothetical protein